MQRKTRIQNRNSSWVFDVEASILRSRDNRAGITFTRTTNDVILLTFACSMCYLLVGALTLNQTDGGKNKHSALWRNNALRCEVAYQWHQLWIHKSSNAVTLPANPDSEKLKQSRHAFDRVSICIWSAKKTLAHVLRLQFADRLNKVTFTVHNPTCTSWTRYWKTPIHWCPNASANAYVLLAEYDAFPKHISINEKVYCRDIFCNILPFESSHQWTMRVLQQVNAILLS